MIPNVLSAAVSRGCSMLHPGYGFLSENAVFVEMCREHGINFIGPNVSPSIGPPLIVTSRQKRTNEKNLIDVYNDLY